MVLLALAVVFLALSLTNLLTLHCSTRPSRWISQKNSADLKMYRLFGKKANKSRNAVKANRSREAVLKQADGGELRRSEERESVGRHEDMKT